MAIATYWVDLYRISVPVSLAKKSVYSVDLNCSLPSKDVEFSVQAEFAKNVVIFFQDFLCKNIRQSKFMYRNYNTYLECIYEVA